MTDPQKATISLHKPNSPVETAECTRIPTGAENAPGAYLHSLGWAFTDAPTIQAYQRHTGEDVAPIFARYREWAEENLLGSGTS